jgi:hypothetical protein
MTMLSWSLFGIAALPLGVLADHIGIRETHVVMGAATVVLIIVIQALAHLKHASRDRFTAVGLAEREAAGEAAGGGGG